MKEEKLVSWSILGLLLLVVIALGGMIAYMFMGPSSSSQRQAAAQAINSLYRDDSRNYLADDYSPDKVKEVKQVINKVGFLDRKTYQDQVTQAETMYTAVAKLDEVYQVKAIKDRGVTLPETEDLLLKEGVNQNQIKQSLASLKPLQDTGLGKDLHELYAYGQEIFDRKGEVERSVSNLPEYEDDFDSLSQAVTAVEDLENQYAGYLQQPVYQDVKDKLDAYAKQVATMLVEYPTALDEDSSLVDRMIQSPSLKLGLKGSKYDQELKVALTFDDGPNDEFTPQLLAICDKYGIKASFFLMGAYVDEYPEMAKRIMDEGHYVGNHSYNHFDLNTLTDDEVIQQFEWTNMAIEEATGQRPSLYRMPFGGGGERVYDLLADMGMESVMWTLDSADWSLQERDPIIDNVMKYLGAQDVILMHDTNQATVDAVDQLIPKLQEMGYEFVAPTEIESNPEYFDERDY